jgi:hypothetical protein
MSKQKLEGLVLRQVEMAARHPRDYVIGSQGTRGPTQDGSAPNRLAGERWAHLGQFVGAERPQCTDQTGKTKLQEFCVIRRYEVQSIDHQGTVGLHECV